MKTFKLTLTEKQAHIVITALDLYTRIGIGQIERVMELFSEVYWKDIPNVERARQLVLEFKEALTGYPMNASHGIHSDKVRDTFRAAYDITQVLRHAVAWGAKPEGGIEIWFDKPRQISEQSLPTIETVEVEEPEKS